MRQKGNKTTRHKYRPPKRQRRGFLNRYDFAYAGRNIVNQVTKIASGLIKNASSEINNIAQQQINQIIRRLGKKLDEFFLKFSMEQSKMFIRDCLEGLKTSENNSCRI